MSRSVYTNLNGSLASQVDRSLHFNHEYFFFPHTAGRGGLANRFHCGIDKIVGQNHFQFDLRNELDAIFPASVNFRMPLAATMPAHTGNSHASDAKLGENCFDGAESRRLNDRF
jgi:hypothetical protein